MKKLLLLTLLLTNQAFAQISSPEVNATIVGGSVSLSGPSAVTQSGTWTTGRTWSLLNTTDSVNAVQSGTWGVSLLTGANVIGSVNQNGTWTTGRTWSLLNTTDSVNSVQSGTWNVGLLAGSNAIGSITNTAFGISGTLPAFAATPTFNIGTISGISTETTLSALNTKVPTGLTTKAASTAAVAADQALVVAVSPNNTVNVAGTVTANLGTIAGVATETTLSAINTKTPALGQNTMTNSTPVVVASNQSAIPVYKTDSVRATYNASMAAITVGTTPTDVFTIIGSATRLVRVFEVAFSCTQTTGSHQDVLLLRRSTANTGGTSTTRTAVPFDSTAAAATAVVRSFTVNPTLGTLVGVMRADKIAIGTPQLQTGGGNSSTNVNVDGFIWRASDLGQAIVLRGINETLAVNLNSVTITGSSCNAWVTWTEE